MYWICGIWRNVCCQSDLFSACVSNYTQSNTKCTPHRWACYCDSPLLLSYIFAAHSYLYATHTGDLFPSLHNSGFANRLSRRTDCFDSGCVHSFHPQFSLLCVSFRSTAFSLSRNIFRICWCFFVLFGWSFLRVSDFSVRVAHFKGFIQMLVEWTKDRDRNE